jgi:hypothetical protein
MFFGSALAGGDGHKTKYQGKLIEPTVPDVTKAEAHGYDRFSFRKDKKK